ncbi:MAG TPA: bifunctional (p)ppGpp synthetase/guanosine-3',5'-bis(diphosphate) 3'-pyrophosphohydrolase [Deltaproteobacteria bacterium]|nr:bifunctional (p)ppGpp synthetase/guanosine-3',5'-bis(diphosphate) 3'-pyrophosphohydrolase [Deltaproteobacteria bacterium]
MVRLEDILERIASYNPGADLDTIKKAYVFAGMVHKGQIRQTGEPYLSHPLEVAYILAGLKMDSTTVATGLLHDTVEDTHTTLENIERVFGAEVARLVDGLTKLSGMTFEKKRDREVESFRKMLLAMANDIRVIVIKLADRLHNMRTLAPLRPEKRRKIAQETLDIYAPLANRLGIGWMKTELEDLCFRYLEPDKYEWLKEKVARGVTERESYIRKVREIIAAKLADNGIEAEVTGRPKHLYSIYKKMQDQELEFENIHDLIAFRVVVKEVRDCYTVLGVVHSNWRPVPGRFKDYIALPKPNGYQSLHTTVFGPYGERMEVQIRTEQMHNVAEYGVAAHWKYKEGKVVRQGRDERNFAWLRQLLEWQRDLTDSDEFMETVKVDLFPEEVFVFTPGGDIKELPVGATAVDFAYAIHTDVGHRCTGAKVNGRMVPLRHPLKNGDVVEIITSPNHKPSPDWLNFVASSRARTKIRQWLKSEEREKSLALGKEICDKELRRHNIELGRLLKSGELDKIATESFGLKDAKALMANIGYGKISVGQLLGRILPPEKMEHRHGAVSRFRQVIQRLRRGPRPQGGGVLIQGIENVLVRFAKCCNPLPGDSIVGYISHGQGVTIHAANCPNTLDIDSERRIEVEWDRRVRTTRPVRIEVICSNDKGLLADMSNAIKNADANITSANISTKEDNRSVCNFEVEVCDKHHLNSIIRALQKIRKVKKVERIRGGAREAEASGA